MTPSRNPCAPEPTDDYEFGRLPRVVAHFPFTTREFARLLVLRGRVRDGLIGVDDWVPSVQSAPESSRLSGPCP